MRHLRLRYWRFVEWASYSIVPHSWTVRDAVGTEFPAWIYWGILSAKRIGYYKRVTHHA